MGSAEREIERKKKIKSIIEDINSGQEDQILTALKELKLNGDNEVIRPLINTWNNTVSSTLEKEIITFIGDIRSTSSAPIIMEILQDEKYHKIHQLLLTTVWNSLVDYSNFLSQFVKIAIQNDFLIAFECLTIIENLHGPFEEEQLLESEVLLREYAENQQKDTKESPQKIMLLQDIYGAIKSFDKNVE